MKNQICNYLTTLLPETTTEQFLALVETPPEASMGDFALPCFSFAKVLRKNPKLIAEELAAGLMEQAKMLGIEKAEAVLRYLSAIGNINAKRPSYNRWQTNRTNIFVPESHPHEGGAGEKRHTTRLARRRATAQDGR